MEKKPSVDPAADGYAFCKLVARKRQSLCDVSLSSDAAAAAAGPQPLTDAAFRLSRADRQTPSVPLTPRVLPRL